MFGFSRNNAKRIARTVLRVERMYREIPGQKWPERGGGGGGRVGFVGEILSCEGENATVKRADTEEEIECVRVSMTWHEVGDTVFVMPYVDENGEPAWVIMDKINGLQCAPPTVDEEAPCNPRDECGA